MERVAAKAKHVWGQIGGTRTSFEAKGKTGDFSINFQKRTSGPRLASTVPGSGSIVEPPPGYSKKTMLDALIPFHVLSTLKNGRGSKNRFQKMEPW